MASCICICCHHDTHIANNWWGCKTFYLNSAASCSFQCTITAPSVNNYNLNLTLVWCVWRDATRTDSFKISCLVQLWSICCSAAPISFVMSNRQDALLASLHRIACICSIIYISLWAELVAPFNCMNNIVLFILQGIEAMTWEAQLQTPPLSALQSLTS